MAKSFVALMSAIGGACIPVLVASCTTFTTEPVTNAADGPAEAADGSVPPSSDAEAGDGAPPRCQGVICEDFEGDSWKGWTTVGATARLDVTAGEAVSGSRALDLTLSGDAPAILVHSVVAKHVRLTAMVKVLERGGGEVDLMNIVSGAGLGDPGLHFVHAAASSQFGVEPQGATPSLLTAKLEAVFTKVQLELDLNAGRFKYTIGTEAGGGMLPDNFPSKLTTLYVSLGASFTMNVQRPWHVRFDDVVVETF